MARMVFWGGGDGRGVFARLTAGAGAVLGGRHPGVFLRDRRQGARWHAIWGFLCRCHRAIVGILLSGVYAGVFVLLLFSSS